MSQGSADKPFESNTYQPSHVMFWATYLPHGLDEMHDSGLLTACRYFSLFLSFLSRGLFQVKVDCFHSHSVNALSLSPPEHALKALHILPLCQS